MPQIILGFVNALLMSLCVMCTPDFGSRKPTLLGYFLDAVPQNFTLRAQLLFDNVAPKEHIENFGMVVRKIS